MHSSQGSSDSAAAGTLGEAVFQFPATLPQQTFWYLDQVEPGNPAWNIAVRFRIQGPLDADRLRHALQELVRRHEILRTTFSLIGEEILQIVHEPAAISLPVIDLSALPAPAREAEEERLSIAEGSAPFQLKDGPLFRARLLRFSAVDHLLLVTVHHIVSDGWSIGVISDEIAAHYEAFQSPAAAPPELPIQFADYAIWQTEHAGNLEPHRTYWKARLANLPLCEIRPDSPRPRVKTHNSYILSTVLPVALSHRLAEYAHTQGATLYTVALAALKLLIRHYTRQDDIYVGTLVAGRDQVNLEPLVGVFINTLVLRTDLRGAATFPDLLRRVQQTTHEALAHQDLHFQQVVELLRPKRDTSRPTLYSINFIYQRDFVKPRSFAGLTMTPIPSKSPGAIYDLNFFMVERADGWRLSCEYNSDLYLPQTVNRMIGQIRSLFEQIAEHPEMPLTEFFFPPDAGDPLPPYTPGLAPVTRAHSDPGESREHGLRNGAGAR